MQLLLSINRWGRRWIAWMVMGAGILVAEVANSTASPTNRKASPSQRPVPNVQATNAVRVTDELADSLEQRFRLPPKEQGASFEPTKSSAAIALRGKDFGGLGGFENIVNGRYSGLGRGGSVGDELVRNMRVSCSLVDHEMETIPIENDQIRIERV